MRTTLLGLLACALFLGGCSSTKTPASDAPTPLPDGRDLSEDPLDVLGMPQP